MDEIPHTGGTMRIKYAGVALATSALLFAAGCSSSSSDSAAEPSPSASVEASGAPGTIVEEASANEDFSTLVAAVGAAKLVETLRSEGPYTVFAPTNEAFEALPKGLVKKLLKPENQETLKKILTYHVVADKVTSDEITPGDVTTVEGQDVSLSVNGEAVKVNDATVVVADVETANGVIHAIDAVLLPPDVDPAAL